MIPIFDPTHSHLTQSFPWYLIQLVSTTTCGLYHHRVYYVLFSGVLTGIFLHSWAYKVAVRIRPLFWTIPFGCPHVLAGYDRSDSSILIVDNVRHLPSDRFQFMDRCTSTVISIQLPATQPAVASSGSIQAQCCITSCLSWFLRKQTLQISYYWLYPWRDTTNWPLMHQLSDNGQLPTLSLQPFQPTDSNNIYNLAFWCTPIIRTSFFPPLFQPANLFFSWLHPLDPQSMHTVHCTTTIPSHEVHDTLTNLLKLLSQAFDRFFNQSLATITCWLSCRSAIFSSISHCHYSATWQVLPCDRFFDPRLQTLDGSRSHHSTWHFSWPVGGSKNYQVFSSVPNTSSSRRSIWQTGKDGMASHWCRWWWQLWLLLFLFGTTKRGYGWLFYRHGTCFTKGWHSSMAATSSCTSPTSQSWFHWDFDNSISRWL